MGSCRAPASPSSPSVPFSTSQVSRNSMQRSPVHCDQGAPCPHLVARHVCRSVVNRNHVDDTSDTPVEAFERSYPMKVLPAAAGEWRRWPVPRWRRDREGDATELKSKILAVLDEGSRGSRRD